MPQQRLRAFALSVRAVLPLRRVSAGLLMGTLLGPTAAPLMARRAVSVTVNPTTTTLTVSTAKTFTATVSGISPTTVTWSLPGGSTTGTITSAGAYTAPATPGTYKVRATSTASTSSFGESTVTVVAAPVSTITATTPATVGATGLTASVPAQSGSTYVWTVTGGTVTVGSGTNAITYTAGTGTSVSLSCKVTNAAGTASTGSKTITLVAAPSITSFTSAAATLTAGSSTTVTGVFANGTGAVDNGVGAVTSNTAKTVTPAATTTYTLTVTNTAGTKATATRTVTVAPAPDGTITAPSTLTTGATGQTASVPAQAGATYLWSATGGTITAGGTTNVATFSAGAVGTLSLVCKVTNAAGTFVNGTKAITVAAPPSISSFTSAAATITAGTSTTLTGTFSGGTGSVDNAVGALTSATAKTVSPATTTTYTLTVTNAAGTSVTATRTVTVVAAPVTTVTPSATTVTAGTAGLTASVPSQAGCTYAWTVNGGTVTAGTGTNAITYTAGAAGSITLSCQVTNAAGTIATGNATVTSVAAPTISGFTAAASTITRGTSTTLTGTFSGGTGNVDNGVGAATSGTAMTVTPTATTTYTLTVTNAAGASTQATRTITVVDPVDATITAPATALAGTTGLTASVPSQPGCTYAWSISGGTITSATDTNAITFTAGAAGTLNLSCIVTNAAGTSATGNKAVDVTPLVSVSLSPNPVSLSTGQAQLFTATVSGTANTAVTWSIQEGAPGGTIATDGTYTAPATPGTYHIVATSVADPSKSATATATVSQLDVSGTYATSWGSTLVAYHDLATGAYTASDVSSGMAFQGTLQGSEVRGTSTRYGQQAAFSMTFNADGSSLVCSGSASFSATRQVGVVSMTFSPATQVVQVGMPKTFTPLVAGTSDKRVTWAVSGGSITPGGVYTAPSLPGVYTLTATSVAAPATSASATAIVTVDGLLDVSGTYAMSWGGNLMAFQGVGTGVYSADAELNNGTHFQGTLQGSTVTGTWATATGSGPFTMTFSADGATMTFSNAWGTYTGTRQALVTLKTSPEVLVVKQGSQGQLISQVAGSLDKRITWTAAAGSVDAAGVFTANLPYCGITSVTATAVADPTKTQTIPVHVSRDGFLDVSGTYADNHAGATLLLTQEGTAVAGRFPTLNSGLTFEGTLSGSVLRGTWHQNFPEDSGTFLWTFSPDGMSYTGPFYKGSTGAVVYTYAGLRQAGVTVTLTPAESILPPSWNRSFVAQVSGTYDKTLAWSVQEANGGSVSPTGIYTAPAGLGTYHVQATSHADPAKTAVAAVTVGIKGLEVDPSWIRVQPSGSADFKAGISSVPTSVTWSVQEGVAGGQISAGGHYTAPATPGTYHVVATSTLDPTISMVAEVEVAMTAQPEVAITPGAVTLGKNGTATFTATVTGTTNTAVTWSASAGSIDGSGTYTAPNAFGSYTVRATSAADTSVFAEATVTVSAQAGTDRGFTYDANGNLTDDGERTFTWDAENRLVSVTIKATGHRSEFGYDGLGRRVEIVEKDPDATQTLQVTTDKKYLWDGVDIAEERSANGATVTKRFYGQGFVDSDGTTLFYARDHLGSIRELTDSAQTVRARYDYDPYGRMTKISGDRDSVFGYTGHFWHGQSGLFMTLARVYDPSQGRWFSMDTAGDAGQKIVSTILEGLEAGALDLGTIGEINGRSSNMGVVTTNYYRYVWNNPINRVDPYGLQCNQVGAYPTIKRIGSYTMWIKIRKFDILDLETLKWDLWIHREWIWYALVIRKVFQCDSGWNECTQDTKHTYYSEDTEISRFNTTRDIGFKWVRRKPEMQPNEPF